MIGGVIHLDWKVIVNAVIVMACISLVFIGYKANQPMTITGAPRGMMLSLALIGPIYSMDYTWVALHPESFLAKVIAPDPDIPKGVTGASWYEIPGVWWNVVERLSWTMLGKPHQGCHFPLVNIDR